MTALLLIGIAKPEANPCDAPPHVTVDGANWRALALEIDPHAAEAEDIVLDWATRQNAVLSAYVATEDVLPLPLGSVFSEREQLRHHVSNQWRVLARRMDAIAETCEFVLRVEPMRIIEPVANTKDGVTFLRSKLTARKDREKLSDRRRAFLRHLSGAVERHAIDAKHRDGNLFNVAMLIRRAERDSLVSELAALAADAKSVGLRSTLIGPSPAYSFSQGDVACA